MHSLGIKPMTLALLLKLHGLLFELQERLYNTICQKCKTHKSPPSIITSERSLLYEYESSFLRLPDSVKPEWWRFLAGVLLGEVRAEADGVPPLDMGKNSDTGPSYMPLGTAFRMASFRRNPNTALQLIQDRERQRKASLGVCKYTPWMCLSSRGLFLGTAYIL